MKDLTDYHIAYGRASNIPECCIYFFITWWGDNVDTAIGQSYRQTIPCGYICCPKCLQDKTFIRLIINPDSVRIRLQEIYNIR